jgi:hypothetical protein
MLFILYFLSVLTTLQVGIATPHGHGQSERQEVGVRVRLSRVSAHLLQKHGVLCPQSSLLSSL